MIVRWRGDRALADAEGVAAVFSVSQRTVRRHCQPIDYDGDTRRALYDVFACEQALDAVLPRPARTAEAQAQRRLMLAMQRGKR